MRVLAKMAEALPSQMTEAISRARWRHPWLQVCVDRYAERLRNRDAVIHKGLGRGLKFNVGASHASYLLGTTEADLQLLLSALIRPGMTFYDIGANVGFFSVIAARMVGTNGCVVAFEPLPENVRIIKHNSDLNGFAHMRTLDVALGSHNTELPFVVSARSSWGRLSGVRKDLPADLGEIMVKVRQLDDLIKQGLEPPDVIKMDVEGAETDVLAGAAETMRRLRPALALELHGTNAPVAALLERYGYVAIALDGSKDIVGAYWNAHVAALPREKHIEIAELRKLFGVHA